MGRLDRSPKKNWVENKGGLPDYIDRIAVHLNEKGMSISHAIATAINAAKKMCSSGDLNWPGLQHVNLGSKAEACAAVAQWEAMKATANNRNELELIELSMSPEDSFKACQRIQANELLLKLVTEGGKASPLYEVLNRAMKIN